MLRKKRTMVEREADSGDGIYLGKAQCNPERGISFYIVHYVTFLRAKEPLETEASDLAPLAHE